jgi:TPR repeat protein
VGAAALDGDFDRGMAAFRAEDYDTAHEAWQRCADEGAARCQYGLGVLHDEGRGTAVDPRRALRWYERAAAQDFPDALMQLGFVFSTGRDGIEQDPIMAWVWFSRAAALGVEGAGEYRDRVGELLSEDERERAERQADEQSIRYHLQQ